MGEKMKLDYVDCVENGKDVYSLVRKTFEGLAAETEFERKTAPEMEEVPVVVKMLLKRNDIAFVFLEENEEDAERVRQVKNKVMDVECESEKFAIFCGDEKEIQKKGEIVAALMFSPDKLQENIGSKK